MPETANDTCADEGVDVVVEVVVVVVAGVVVGIAVTVVVEVVVVVVAGVVVGIAVTLVVEVVVVVVVAVVVGIAATDGVVDAGTVLPGLSPELGVPELDGVAGEGVGCGGEVVSGTGVVVGAWVAEVELVTAFELFQLSRELAVP